MQQRSQDQPEVRFEATVHGKSRAAAARAVAEFDLDRVPDRKGVVRVLITAEDAARLLEAGYEVRLFNVLPVQPLDPSLVMDDKAAQAWLESQTRGLRREQR
jgi:hypothetical protein